MSLNKVILVGNLGADPEIRQASNTAVCNLRVATNEREQKDGGWVDRTEWHRVVCFGKTAENCEKYLKKGRQVLVEGKIQTKKYTDKEGVERYSTEIVAHAVQFIGGASENKGSPAKAESPAPDFDDDDIPF